MESEAFADVDEGEKAKFLGAFFQWVRHLFQKAPAGSVNQNNITSSGESKTVVEAPPPTFAKKDADEEGLVQKYQN